MTNEILYPSYLVGFRGWLVDEKGQLRSLLQHDHSPTLWPEKTPFMASCQFREVGLCFPGSFKPRSFRRHIDEVPDLRCTCGIYAYKDIFPIMGRWLEPGNAVGRVALWGRVAQHTNGFRSQFAYPVEVLCSDSTTAEAVAAYYGVKSVRWSASYWKTESSFQRAKSIAKYLERLTFLY